MRAVACAACVLGLGCSFIAATPRPDGDGRCMRTRHPAQIDTAVAAAFAVTAVVGLVVDGICRRNGSFGCESQDSFALASGASALVVGVPFAGAAIYGYEKPACVDQEAPALARRAIEAARTGDCNYALALEAEVRDGDPAVYAQLEAGGELAACRKTTQDADAKAKSERDTWCAVRRQEIIEKADALDDPDERAKVLATMPVCYGSSAPAK